MKNVDYYMSRLSEISIFLGLFLDQSGGSLTQSTGYPTELEYGIPFSCFQSSP
jgi:hypothetical protein